MKICLTGGIACGKSLLSRCLNDLGVETLDADDIVHELIPPEERRRLAAVVFKDPAARRELESRLHPIVKAKIDAFLGGDVSNSILGGDASLRRHCEPRSGVAIHSPLSTPHHVIASREAAWQSIPLPTLKIAVIPLLFEAHWESNYDIIICVASDRSKQIERMTTTRGYTREEAEARLAAQLDVAVKIQKSHYVVWNNGTSEDLEKEAVRLVAWLKKETNPVGRTVPVSRSQEGNESGRANRPGEPLPKRNES